MTDSLFNSLIFSGIVVLIVLPIMLVVVRKIFKDSLIYKIAFMLLSLDAIIACLAFLAGADGFIHMTYGVPLCMVLLTLAYKRINKDVRNPLLKIRNNINRLALGDLSIEIGSNNNKRGKDEIGDIINSLTIYLKAIKHTAAFASEIKKGNLKSHYHILSKDDMLGISLLRMRDNLANVIDETSEVIRQAGEEGNLKVKMNSDKKEGAWKDLSEAINNLILSIATPVLNVNEIVNAMAIGDLTKRYKGVSKGEIMTLAKNLNKALDSIKMLLSKISSDAIVVNNSSMEMHNSSEEMNVNTAEIASAISQMSNGAHNQVTKVNESSVLVEQILMFSKQMKKQAETINNAAEQGVKNSENGLEMVNQTVLNMEDISNYSNKTNESVEALTLRSEEITKVLKVIADIANQTNLLALNAAIEAAQAGDAGRGFAVVAEEIRKLAENSKNSASEIEQLINDIQKDTEKASKAIETMGVSVRHGEESSRNASMAFTEISNSSSQSLNLSVEILNATQKQMDNIMDVVGITEGIAVIAEQTATGTEEVAASSAELSSGMEDYTRKSQQVVEIILKLKNDINRFKLVEKGIESYAVEV